MRFCSFHFDDPAVPDIGIDSAVHAGGADIADGLSDLDAGFRARYLGFYQLFKGCHDFFS
jgi:hypothetical protein